MSSTSSDPIPLSNRPYDIVIFGVTGVTGKRCAEELIKQQSTAVESAKNLKWAISGRSEDKLKKVRADLVNKLASNVNKITENDIGIILADVQDHKSLVTMCSQTRVLMNLVGPYRFLGFNVLNACVESKTHMCDVSGEPWYLEKQEFEYDEKAKQAGVTFIGSVGFDSIPADIGSLFLQKEFERAMNATLLYVDSYVSIHSGASGFVGHSTTFECACHGMREAKSLSSFRKQIYKENPLPPRFRFPSQHFGIKKSFIQSFVPWFSDPRLKGPGQNYCFMFPGADASIVRRSQTRILRLKEKETNAINPGFFPIQYNAYFTVASLWGCFLLTLGGIIMSLMNKTTFTQNLMIKYPSIFTFGVFSHEGPTPQQLRETTFSMTMLGQGFSKNSLDKKQLEEYLTSGKPLPKPDTKMKVVVSGPEAGYVATPLYHLEVAKLMLENCSGCGSASSASSSSNKIEPGAFSPSAGLYNVSDELIERLAKFGCKFESVKM